MKALFCLFALLSFATFAFSQSFPILPKEWIGTVSVTSMGTTSRFNPKHEDNVGKEKAPLDWNTYNEPRTLTILRQDGRHLELLVKSSLTEDRMVGTVSVDGKQLQTADKNSQFLLTISADGLHGCGTSRGAKGTFEDWLNKYTASCYDFTAMK